MCYDLLFPSVYDTSTAIEKCYRNYELNKAYNLKSNIFLQNIFIRTQIKMFVLCLFND